MIARPDLLDDRSPPGLEVFQLTTDATLPSCHVYMEAQIFMPDSRRFFLHCSAHVHGSDKSDPRHRYLLCDLEDNGRLIPVTDEVGATAPAVSPDGQYIYYFVDQTEPGGGQLTLKRRPVAGGPPEILLVLDQPLPGTSFRPSRIYSLSTISSDGRRLGLSCFLGDGRSRGAPYGLMIFDIPSATVRLILHGVSWCNMHPQYSRSQDPRLRRNILVQENHGFYADELGVVEKSYAASDADIHVIRDDGMNFRNLPWGRNGIEHCQGHQCWRGRSDWAITSTNFRGDVPLIESQAVEHVDHNGLHSRGGRRNILSREFQRPEFPHFATDIAGRRLIADSGAERYRGALFLAALGEPGRDPMRPVVPLVHVANKATHAHPFLSPDGTLAFYNSDESGVLQAYMVRGLPAI